MIIRSARIGVRLRDVLGACAEVDGLTLSEAVRKAAILGMGGTTLDAYRANADMRAKRRDAIDRYGEADYTPPKDGLDIVSCRLPSPWAQRCMGHGQFAQAVRAGIQTWAASIGISA